MGGAGAGPGICRKFFLCSQRVYWPPALRAPSGSPAPSPLPGRREEGEMLARTANGRGLAGRERRLGVPPRCPAA